MVSKTNAVTVSITTDQIVDCASEILADQQGPIRLSILGQELTRRLGTSIRQALGHRPLADAILEKLSDQYEVQGAGPHKEIGKKGTWKHSQKYPHYLGAFWDNFERPLGADESRWLLPGQPKAVDVTGIEEFRRSFFKRDSKKFEGSREIGFEPASQQEMHGRATVSSSVHLALPKQFRLGCSYDSAHHWDTQPLDGKGYHKRLALSCREHGKQWPPKRHANIWPDDWTGPL